MTRISKSRLCNLALAIVLASGFASCSRKGTPVDWSAVLKPVQEKYAPDTRLTVFQVKVRPEGKTLTAEGEVEVAAAKEEVLRRVAEISGTQVTDRIRVLPDAALAPKDRGLVIVSVGNLRGSPEHSAELVTQVLLGDTLRLLGKKGGWYHVQCPDRYLGWIDGDALALVDAATADEWSSSDRLIVTRQYELLRAQPGPEAAVVCDLVAGDVLRYAGDRGSWIEAALPDGRRGYVERGAIAHYESWRSSRRLSPENIEATARAFMGVPYLWGGTSAKGFDCSGFVKTVFALNGTPIERDADQQARGGKEIEPGANFGNLTRGDLLFFGRKATAEKPERIVHVGIYLADRQFIHCSGRVRVSSLDPASPDYDEWHVTRFLRARRFAGPQ